MAEGRFGFGYLGLAAMGALVIAREIIVFLVAALGCGAMVLTVILIGAGLNWLGHLNDPPVIATAARMEKAAPK